MLTQVMAWFLASKPTRILVSEPPLSSSRPETRMVKKSSLRSFTGAGSELAEEDEETSWEVEPAGAAFTWGLRTRQA